MSDFRKSLIVYILLVSLLAAPLQTFAAEVSACGGCSVPNSHPDAWRFYDKIRSFPNWTGNYYKEDNNCKEVHYKRVSLGGQNNAWVDSSDIHYHISHGGSRWDAHYGKWLTAILFEDGTSLVPSEARVAWGDTDLEWIGLRNCTLLNNASKAYWANAMNKLHLLLGFKTNSSKHDNFGKKWANKMKKTTILWWTIPGQTVTQAWFNATDETQPSGTTARVLAETFNCYNDHLWYNGSTSSDPPVDNWYWWWDHTAGSPEYLAVNSLETMNVYEVVPRTVNEAYVQQVGRAFDLTSEVGDLCETLVMADVSDPANPKVLEVSKATGHFYFHDDGKLFLANPDVRQFDPKLAEGRALQFLEEFGLLPQDVGASDVEFDTLTEESRDEGEVRQTLYANTNAVFARQLPGDPTTGQMVSVAGAGARLKVYLFDDGQNGEVMGAMGNWREVRRIGEIPVNDGQTAWSFFDRYGEKIAITPTFVEYDKAIPNDETATQGYYELPGQVHQTELIPVWIFEVEYYMEDRLVLTADTFIPAAMSYLPPVVEIIKPAEFKTFEHGEMVDFDCQVEEGFGTTPYSYNWESSVDGFLSTQKRFQTDLLSVHCPDESLDCSPLPHTITVTVTDAKEFQANDSIQITVIGPCDECADPADLNHSGTVDMKDLAHWADRYLTHTGHTGPR
jgi:hypothetical protein